MSVHDIAESGVRNRTRRAIVAAAIGVMTDNPTAPLGDIAEAAGVGRSTLHRYFPERTDLLRAVALEVHAASNAAIEAADPTNGPIVPALRRVVESQLDLGPIMLYVYTEPLIQADRELAAFLDTGDEVITEILARATADRPAYPPGWSRRVFWSLLLSGYSAVRDDGIPRHQVVDAIMNSLTQGTITSA
ncbi:TetR/AcrR family transcriptional regulator [Mycolicibacterium bacteremicum]|uniref:TetR family transcriptional regulator n=1 Tax=Mycolicibacterium bacteremicum TaxID=564198 RepID=A0A1W9YQ73_MYCBA|nr:TetR/AcrR family transcriptional regulator [Mycolicibacterium bacteremicum]MCV7430207.1 TetR/AcrR family transcriptional regulator [Mycolicibacterium bacteremicum]ORA02221.1 TetR family transcriptional regulator [Mycolicibacterium bacteremicum]